MNPAPIAAVDHEAGLTQDAQVMRHERLADVEQDHQVADGAFAGTQVLENPQTGLVTQGAEPERGDGAGLVGTGGQKLY